MYSVAVMLAFGVALFMAVCFIVLIVAVPRHYNTICPYDKDFFSLKMCTEMTAAELAAIVNLVNDIQTEMRRPFFMRLWKYPVKQLDDLYSLNLRRVKAMNDLYEAKREYKED